MRQQTVSCTRALAHPADTIWSWVGDFFGAWHPAILSCEKHGGDNGHERRQFIGTDGGTYEEELRYYSASERRLAYVLTRGISNIGSYRGTVEITPETSTSCTIMWHAEIEMDDAEVLEQVASGTAMIFEAGFDWLEENGGEVNHIAEVPRQLSMIAPIRHAVNDNTELSMLICPKKDATTLVLCLHGIGGNATNWMPQLLALGDTHWMAALDCRGYGQSRLGDTSTTIEDYCNDIVKVVADSGAKRLILVGLSMGSWIATSFAMRYPKLLEGLVFAGGCTGMSEATADTRDGFRKSRSKPLLTGQTTADMADDVVAVICGPDTGVEVKAEMAASMAAIPNETYLDALRCFTAPSEAFDFSKISCPVLMMTGVHDRLAPPEEIKTVSERISAAHPESDVRFEVIERAGHICNLEAPDAFNSYLAAFLARFPATQDSPASKRKEEKRQVKRRQILMAALSEFSLMGYDGVSMDKIAAKASVSKPTLYQYFGDKDQLFDAVLNEGSGHILAPLMGGGGSLVDQLWNFSWTYAEYVLRPEILSMARLILGEASRRPQSAAAYYQAGPGRAFQGVHDFVKDSVDKGLLAADDTALAAENLWSLILSGQRDHHLHFVNDTPSTNAVARVIHHGLKVFLTVYSTNLDNDLRELDVNITNMNMDDYPFGKG